MNGRTVLSSLREIGDGVFQASFCSRKRQLPKSVGNIKKNATKKGWETYKNFINNTQFLKSTCT